VWGDFLGGDQGYMGGPFGNRQDLVDEIGVGKGFPCLRTQSCGELASVCDDWTVGSP
jgi:hypothetical protein